MKNSEKYLFSDFTFINYESLLTKAKQNYKFSYFTNFDIKDNFILWRHDVDYSLENALIFSKIEKKFYISATYFIHLHNEHYNFIELEYSDIIKEILSMDHALGLHFDVHYYNIKTEKELLYYLLKEKEVLEFFFNKEVKVFSFHNTNPFILSHMKDKYAGMINVYSNLFQKKIKYCSDSNGYWRFERLQDVLDSKKYPQLQVLTHPVLWHNEPIPPRRRIFKCIDDNASRLKDLYDNHLKKYNRENIDW
ncbi:MAG: hypothetical protein K9J13_16925 [Saprospiraceae bacterium]|nr:hypothetical protein [Saprospiraceae bacterium]